jgi:hypothetical protein
VGALPPFNLKEASHRELLMEKSGQMIYRDKSVLYS